MDHWKLANAILAVCHFSEFYTKITSETWCHEVTRTCSQMCTCECLFIYGRDNLLSPARSELLENKAPHDCRQA